MLTLSSWRADPAADRVEATLSVDDFAKWSFHWAKGSIDAAHDELSKSIATLVLTEQRDAIMAALTPDVIAEAVKDGIARAVVQFIAKGSK